MSIRLAVVQETETGRLLPVCVLTAPSVLLRYATIQTGVAFELRAPGMSPGSPTAVRSYRCILQMKIVGRRCFGLAVLEQDCPFGGQAMCLMFDASQQEAAVRRLAFHDNPDAHTSASTVGCHVTGSINLTDQVSCTGITPGRVAGGTGHSMPDVRNQIAEKSQCINCHSS